MNTDIETLLRKAPPVRPPQGLLRELSVAIELPTRRSTATREENRTANRSWFSRWIPALGFALWFLACVVVFGIQTSQLAALREQKRVIEEAKAAAAEEVLAANIANTSVTTELERLQKDLADVQRLRAEMEQLRAELAAGPALLAENERLRAELSTRVAPSPRPEDDYFAAAGNRVGRMKCIDNLKQVGMAARIWANDHGDKMPPSFDAMKNELVNEAITFCPSDESARYRYLSPGVEESDPSVVLTHCPIHHNAGMVDGSAQMLAPRHKVVQRNGKWIVE